MTNEDVCKKLSSRTYLIDPQLAEWVCHLGERGVITTYLPNELSFSRLFATKVVFLKTPSF